MSANSFQSWSLSLQSMLADGRTFSWESNSKSEIISFRENCSPSPWGIVGVEQSSLYSSPAEGFSERISSGEGNIRILTAKKLNIVTAKTMIKFQNTCLLKDTIIAIFGRDSNFGRRFKLKWHLSVSCSWIWSCCRNFIANESSSWFSSLEKHFNEK